LIVIVDEIIVVMLTIVVDTVLDLVQ